MDEQTPDNTKSTAGAVFKREDEFASLYANNVSYQPSVWDLKMLFGELDQSETPNLVRQHTAMTIPWLQVKLCAYYLLLHIIVNQTVNGNIGVPPAVLPPRPDPDDPAIEESGKKTVRYLAWVHDQFFGGTPYVPPEVEQESAPPSVS
jgi:hypothetical protein